MDLTLLYVHSTSIGYARLGTKLTEALERQGVTVYDSQGETPAPDVTSAAVETGERRAPEQPTSLVCWLSIPSHVKGWWSGQHPTLFTMYETTHLPAVFHEGLDAIERICVPSEQNVELFSRHHPDVRYVPLGIDPADWHYAPRPNGVFFDFLIAGAGQRKGLDLAYRAFEKVFGDNWPNFDPIPRLVMKSPRPQAYDAEWLVQITGRLDDAQELDLYAMSHVYVQPSRGEGFGLQPLQAMAQGMPTILTDAHGHAGFAHLGTPIPARQVPSEQWLYGEDGDWWEPDFDQLCEAMWFTYADYGGHLDRAKHSAVRVAESWTWDHTATRFIDEMADLMEPTRVTNTWVWNPHRVFLTVTNRDWSADIGGMQHRFTRGERYYETADVKRVMFEAGLLDPVCVSGLGVEAGSEDDLGLTPEQVARLGDYSAAHAYCPTCRQQLNTQPTRADAMEAM